MGIKSITIGGRSDVKKVTLNGGVLFEAAHEVTWSKVNVQPLSVARYCHAAVANDSYVFSPAVLEELTVH